MTGKMRETVRHYIFLRAVSSFGVSFIAAFYATFLIAKGLNLLQVNLVNFVFFATLFVCEIPTGAFADVFGRKLSFVISCILFSAGLFIYGVSSTFIGFVIAEVISAIGATFASGAFQAWLIDRMRHLGFEGSFGKIFALEQQIRNGTGIIAAILGAFLADKSASLPWFAGGVVMGIAAIMAMVYMREEDEFVRKKFSFKDGFRAMNETVQVATRYCAANKVVRFILIASTAQFFAVQAANMQWQPFFSQFLPNKTSLGFIYAGSALAMMVGSYIAPHFLGLVKDEKKAISFSQMVIGMGILSTVLFHAFVPALSVFLVHEIARGLFVPLKDVYLNDNIPSKERATLISFDSISHHIGGMIGLLVSGVVAQYISMSAAWMMSGMVLVSITLILIKNGRKAGR